MGKARERCSTLDSGGSPFLTVLRLCDVLPGAGVTSHADHRNRAQRVIGLAISATIESMMLYLARRCLKRTDSTKSGQRRFAVQAGGIFASGHQQSSGRLRTDTEASKKPGCSFLGQAGQLGIKFA